MPPTLTKPVKPFPDFGPLLTYAESVKSATAIRKGINNTPTAEQYRNMAKVYNLLYLPICAEFGRVPVSSFFRSPALNRAIGGSKTSAHMAGLAIDLDCDGLSHVSNTELYQWIRGNLRFDQVILEGFNAVTAQAAWVHVGLPQNGVFRQQALKMVRQQGKTIYTLDND